MMTIHHPFQTPTIPLMRADTSSSASPNRAGTWLCPILSAENEFD